MEQGPYADACPYRRPFPDDFDGCAAYQPIRAFPIDTRHRPLRPIWTCGHLEVGNADRGRAYARCRLGDAAARKSWAEDFGTGRLDQWRRVAADFGTELEPQTRRLYELKDRQLGASTREERAAAAVELERTVDAFLDLHRKLLAEHRAELAAIEFPAAAVRALTVEAMRSFILRTSLSVAWAPPEELLDPFPTPIREFLEGLFGGSTSASSR